jgi:3'(2'), 5'-bisphosphate nucleotidase
VNDNFPTTVPPGLLDDITTLAAEASAAILAIAQPKVREKADKSPVTEADEAAEAIILRGLRRIAPQISIVSEESGASDATRLDEPFFLVDPLDGTREFIAGRPEFTVNIALMVNRQPLLGVVTAPALNFAWRGERGRGAARSRLDGSELQPIRTRTWPTDAPIALVSRSHLDAASTALLARIPGAVTQSCGSAVKFCRLAEGNADLYPRLAQTSEWDVAAGHAVLLAAGGTLTAPDGQPIRYGDASRAYIVPGFLAFGDPQAAARLCAG